MNENKERRFVILLFLIIVVVLTIISINKENVTLPNHALPLLAFFNLFKDSQKMKAIDRKIIRHQRDMVTRKLFKTMIWLVFVLALIGLAVSTWR